MIVPRIDVDAEAILQTADEIGQRLAHEAVWHAHYCNWLGAEPAAQSRMSGQPGMVYRTLGPDLYSGTSGVALFLAELYTATKDVTVLRTALGAIRQWLWRAEDIPPPNRWGLYTGWVGMALVAARLGTLLGEEELVEGASQLLRRVTLESPCERELDLISGNAGAIAALVILQELLDDASLLGFAVQLGDELLQSADKSDAGYSWSSSAFPKQRNLTGFSHGTAGVGYALLELFRVTGDSAYRRGAELAFQYERHWFDAGRGNWPDFREISAKGKWSRDSIPFATHWCHGAPGVALSRLRAYEILQDGTCKAEALTALETTRTMIETELQYGISDFSLCHGLAGNADVLLYGCRVLGQERADKSSLTLQVANSGIENYATRGLSWPCGTGSAETPNLMLGLAGIGYYYLRLYAPEKPSVLILRREMF